MKPGIKPHRKIRVPLQHPLEVDGVTYSVLSLRKGKKKDLSKLYFNSKFELGIVFTARICGVTPTVIYALHPDDAERVGLVAQALSAQGL